MIQSRCAEAEKTFTRMWAECQNKYETNLFLPHLGKLVEKGEVLGQVFAVWLDAVLHDGQEGLDESSDAGSTPDVFHGAVHVIGAERTQKKREGFAPKVTHNKIDQCKNTLGN